MGIRKDRIQRLLQFRQVRCKIEIGTIVETAKRKNPKVPGGFVDMPIFRLVIAKLSQWVLQVCAVSNFEYILVEGSAPCRNS